MHGPLELKLSDDLAAFADAPSDCTAVHIIVDSDSFEVGRLSDCVQAAKCKQLSFRMFGAPGPALLDAIAGAQTSLADPDVYLTADFVISDAADVTQYRLSDANWLHAIVRATQDLRGRGIATRWIAPLTEHVTYRLDGLMSLAQEVGAETVILPSQALNAEANPLDAAARLFAWDFVTYRVLDEDADRFTPTHLAYYKALAEHLKDAKHPLPEAQVLVADPDKARGWSDSDRRRAQIADVKDVLTGGVMGHLRACLRGLSPGKERKDIPQMPFVLLIGAYGGEHIGDAAILGGVLRRIHAQFGTTRAILMTQRPNHTEHLIPMLDTPVDVQVQEYTYANIAEALRSVEGVVFAGGPLTDLPKQLVRHLFTVARAKGRDLPFVMEGVGPGTFVRLPSQITARRFVSMADRITIRTKDDAGRALIKGCDFHIGRDPAFDYLETRGDPLTRLPEFETGEIDALLKGRTGGKVIGLNIRPIGHAYTPAAPGRDPVKYTYEVQDRFEREFAAGLAAYAAGMDQKPTFVFFPMNAIQFGMSDLRSAHRIMSHLPKGVDYRIWEADASLDGVVALLRRLDAVVSMRFHATIFALSQNCPVLGIDYRIGKRDKVAAVLSDAGREEDCCRIDELRADWLSANLKRILN